MALTKLNNFMPTGSVLQTVVQQETGATTFTASGTSDKLLLASGAGDSTSHLSLSITPQSTSSKIFLTASVFYEGTADVHQYLWFLYRDSTKLAAPVAGSRGRGIKMSSFGHSTSDANSTPDSANFSYYDSPNTTSSITYAVAFSNTTSGVVVYLNRTVNNADTVTYERGVSVLMAQEIAV